MALVSRKTLPPADFNAINNTRKARRAQQVEASSNPLESSLSACSAHRVQFYETDAFLVEAVSEFIGAGLGADIACVVLATPAHCEELAARLQANGLNLTAAQAEGRYIALDAAETLSQFLVDGSPDPDRFAQVISPLIEQAAKGRQGVRIFGEMVALLWEQGNPSAALLLETLWNELGSSTHSLQPFTLLCAYPMSLFVGSAHTDLFAQLCALHTQSLPDEGYTHLDDHQEQLQAVSLFRQKALSLKAEIAERQAAEERLRASEERYRRLFEASTDGIVLVEPVSGRITDANPALLHLLGASYNQVVGRELWQVGLMPDQPAQQTLLQQAQRERTLRYDALRVAPRSGGELRQVEWVCTLFQANGHPVLQCNLRDITDRTQAEEARLRLAAIVSSSEDAILSKDLDGVITSWNRAAERLYGYSAQEIVGRSVSLLFPADRHDEFSQIMERIRRGERVPHYETQRVRKDGSVAQVSVTVSPITTNNGTVIGASDIARDISERVALERQREAFISLVTHELRTPLTSLQANLQLAQRWLTRLLSQIEQPSDEQQRLLEDLMSMVGRSQHALRAQQRLINDLLDLARLQENKMEIHLAACNLLELVTQTVQDQQVAHPARLITLDLPEQDPILVEADRDRLQQVLNNYLTNAIKFSPETEPIHVGVSVQAEVARVWVQDHGPGLTSEQQKHVWQQFYQAPNTPVQGGWKAGLGLGLYVTQQLIQRQHGEVGVQSHPGQGATFWFTAPLCASHATP